MKKKLIVIASVVLALAVLAGGAYAYVVIANPFHRNDLTGFAQANPVEHSQIAPMHLNGDGEFVVLQFTDTHLVNTRGQDARTLRMIAYHTARVKPDLVVITGDMIEGRSARYHLNVDRHAALHGIAGIFERLGQPWAFTPGNNDHEFMGSAQDVVAFLAYHYDYFLVSNEPDLPGAVNFVIDLQGEHQLIFIDSLSRHEIMQQSQAGWLAAQLQNGVPSSVFFHYNTPMFYQAGYRFQGRPGDDLIDEVVLAANNVGLVSVGHTHPLEHWLAHVNGTYFSIARASGYQRGDDYPGGLVITIRPGAEEPYSFYDFAF